MASFPSDDILVRNARLAVKMELEKKRALGQPIARFDEKTKRLYMENADGTITEFGTAMKEGRYSERQGKKTGNRRLCRTKWFWKKHTH